MINRRAVANRFSDMLRRLLHKKNRDMEEVQMSAKAMVFVTQNFNTATWDPWSYTDN